MTKFEIIEDTVKFYGEEPTRRSKKGNECLYQGSGGRQCAFQRVVETDLSAEENRTALGIMRSFGKDLEFKPGYEGHEALFWNQIQTLHDIDDYWSKTGLSEQGLKKVEQLKKDWA